MDVHPSIVDGKPRTVDSHVSILRRMQRRAPFQASEVLLLGPGPSPVHPEVLAAQAAPVLGHLDPDFIALMDRVQADLRTLYGTENAFTVPISATGSAGMEACIVNLVEPGDRCVIGIHGVFGGRMRELCERQGGVVEVVECPFGTPLDSEAMIRAIQSGGACKLVGFVHAETSTGVLMPGDEVKAIASAAREAGGFVVLDCVTSLAGCPVELDAWGVDAAYSGTQKCLGVPPGLSPVSLSDRALEAIRTRAKAPTSWYLDAMLLGGYWGSGSRKYHHTGPISAVYGLARGLDLVLDEGLEARFARHKRIASALYEGLGTLGLECLVDEGYRTPMLSSVCVPDGIDAGAVNRSLRSEHHIEIGGGLGSLAGKVWRIGLMGYGARIQSVRRVIIALADALQAQGHACDAGAALAALRSYE